MHLLIVSGRSGSGKTISLDVLEDIGYYCIDNLPIKFASMLYEQIDEAITNVAVSIDARNLPNDLALLKTTLSNLQNSKHHCQILYLDANDMILLKRFSETRRRHPLTQQNTPLNEAIQQESSLLMPISELADISIDTSSLSAQQLKQLIKDRFQSSSPQLQVLIKSFGFKYGIPSEADYVFDVRCLPNPYWQPNLRAYSGLDQPIQDFLQQHAPVQQMIASIEQFLQLWIPTFAQDNRSYLTIAIGCTGGQHRSVFCAEQISKALQNNNYELITRHRDVCLKKDLD